MDVSPELKMFACRDWKDVTCLTSLALLGLPLRSCSGHLASKLRFLRTVFLIVCSFGLKVLTVFCVRLIDRVIAFEHRRSAVLRIGAEGRHTLNGVIYNVDLEKSSSTAAYEYFCGELPEHASDDVRMSSFLVGVVF